MQAEIYLMRHGQTDWNAAQRMQGGQDICLNAVGEAQAAAAAEHLRGLSFARVYTSPLQRALRTACLSTGLTPQEMILDDRLREMRFGAWEGKSYGELGHKVDVFFDEPEKHIPPAGAESYEALLSRAADFLSDLRAQVPDGGRALVVSHGATLHAILAVALGTPLHNFWGHQLHNCKIMRLCMTPGGFFLPQADSE